MTKTIESGARFGHLVYHHDTEIKQDREGRRRLHCLLKCDCGWMGEKPKTLIAGGRLRSCLKSCLVQRTERGRKLIKTGAYAVISPDQYKAKKKCVLAYRAMILRCHDPNNSYYYNYGARGITVCEKWRRSIYDFLSDMGEPPSLYHSLDRIDNNGNYEPSNCRWANWSEQSRNRRSNREITLNGETMCLQDWSKRLGVPISTISRRLSKGLPLEVVLSPIKLPKRIARARTPEQLA